MATRSLIMLLLCYCILLLVWYRCVCRQISADMERLNAENDACCNSLKMKPVEAEVMKYRTGCPSRRETGGGQDTWSYSPTPDSFTFSFIRLFDHCGAAGTNRVELKGSSLPSSELFGTDIRTTCWLRVPTFYYFATRNFWLNTLMTVLCSLPLNTE